MLLLRRRQVVDEELNRLGRIAVARVLLAVELVRQLERIPVADRDEELDVPDDLVVVPDQQRPLVAIPQARLGEASPQDRLRDHAEREERAAVADV